MRKYKKKPSINFELAKTGVPKARGMFWLYTALIIPTSKLHKLPFLSKTKLTNILEKLL
jgi:hypothetical protein